MHLQIKDYKIIYNDTPCCKFAAQELSSFIRQSTGKTLDVQPFAGSLPQSAFIRIGAKILGKEPQQYQSLNTDGFFIKIEENNVFVDGNVDRGCLFGVYQLLENTIGIRFLAPDTTVIPRRRKLNFGPDCERAYSPLFPLRVYLNGATYFMVSDDQDFMCRQKVRSSFYDYDEKHGGGRAMYGRNTDHNFSFYVPYEIYGKSHPEWYTTKAIGRPEHGRVERTVCLSSGLTDDGQFESSLNESVMSVVISEMKKDIIKHTDTDSFVFEQEDGVIYCKCSKCMENESKYMRSGMLIRFCNVLAEELQKWADAELDKREINIVTFGYSYTKEPPVKKTNKGYQPLHPSVIARDNVVIRLALFHNKAYPFFDKRQNKELKETYTAWNACASRFMFWGYDICYCRYMAYVPTLFHAKSNLKGWHKLNLSYLMVQGPADAPFNWQALMRGYIYHKLMWDMSLTENKLASEFIRGYFGRAAAPYVREFINLYEGFYKEHIQKNRDIAFSTFGNFAQAKHMPLEIVEKALKLVDNAVAATKDGSAANRELYLKHLAALHTTPLASMAEHFLTYYPHRTEEERRSAVLKFYNTAKYSGQTVFAENSPIDELGENGKFPETYKLSYK